MWKERGKQKTKKEGEKREEETKKRKRRERKRRERKRRDYYRNPTKDFLSLPLFLSLLMEFLFLFLS